MFYLIERVGRGINRLHIFATRGSCSIYLQYCGNSSILIDESELDDYVTAKQVAEAYRICMDELDYSA